MFEYFVHVLAAIGLLFLGLKFLTTHLRSLITNKVKKMTAKLVSNDWISALWGVFLKGITQESSVVTFIIASLTSCVVITLREAIPMLTWSNVGGSLIVFLVNFKIQYIVLLILGITGICAFFVQKKMLYHVVYALLGLSLILYSIGLLESTFGSVDMEKMRESLVFIHDWPFTLFILGAGLTVLSQSSVAITILTVNFAQTGFFDMNEAILMIYGVHFGSSIRSWILAAFFQGMIKRVVMTQVIFNLQLVLICVPLYYIETLFDIPLIGAAIRSLSSEPGMQVAYLFLIVNTITCVTTSFFYDPLVKLCFRLCPIGEIEELNIPHYISGSYGGDPGSRVDLSEKEIISLSKRVGKYFDCVRDYYLTGKPTTACESYQEAFHSVADAVLDVLYDINEDHDATDYSNKIQNLVEQLHILNNIEVTSYYLTQVTLRKHVDQKWKDYVMLIVESCDALWMLTVEAVENKDEEAYETIKRIISNKEETLKKLRLDYSSQVSETDPLVMDKILQISSYYERIIWLINRYIKIASNR